MTQTVSKIAIKRINDAPIDVSLWNGCFNIASSEVIVNKKMYSLRVSVTHDCLKWQCGDKNGAELIVWKGCSGEIIPIPCELKDKVDKMIAMATMDDAYAFQLSEENRRHFFWSMKQLGF